MKNHSTLTIALALLCMLTFVTLQPDEVCAKGNYYTPPDEVCNYGALGTPFPHEWSSPLLYRYKHYDNNYHIRVDEECRRCHVVKGSVEAHWWEDIYTKYKTFDNSYHEVTRTCSYCGTSLTTKAKHTTSKTKIIKKATLFSKGRITYYCECGQNLGTKSLPWKRGSKHSESYDVKWNTNIFRNSKYITMTLKKPVKGSTVIVKIGNKKYSKKVGKSKKVKVRVRNLKYGKKVYFTVKYKGKVIGEAPYYDVIYYGKWIRKGITKKQFKWTYNYWGAPDSTASGSGGWSYWYYDDGSYIGFKNGRIKYWYGVD